MSLGAAGQVATEAAELARGRLGLAIADQRDRGNQPATAYFPHPRVIGEATQAGQASVEKAHYAQ